MSSRLQFLIARVSALLLVGLLLGGCARAPDAVLRVGLSTAPTTLDPRLATDATAARLCRLLYSALVDFDSQFMPRPSLATWDIVAPTRYRFHLPATVRFHDGRGLRAADVVATYTSILDPKRASPWRGSLANLRAITAVDPLTVEFELRLPDPLFPGLLVIGIVPAADAERARLPNIPIGSGPFRIAAPVTANRIDLSRVADQQKVAFVVIPNETTRALMLARGELDLAQGGFAPELVTWLAARDELKVTHRRGTVFSYLGFNLRDGPTRDLRVRQALACAIDRAAIVHYAFHDQARLANALLVPSHWAGASALEPLPFDPPRARALLAAAGYSATHPLVLEYKTSSDSFRRRIATIVQSQLKDVGVILHIQSLDWGTFYSDIKAGRFALYGLSWVGLQLPDIFRHAFHSAATPPAGANRGYYADPRVDQLIEQAERTNDLSLRAGLYRELQTVLLRDLPYLPLWYEDTAIVQRVRVVGYDTDANGSYDELAHVAALTLKQ